MISIRLSVTGDDYHLFLEILGMVYAYFANLHIGFWIKICLVKI